MNFELEIKNLCNDFVQVLIGMSNRQEISEEELVIHLKTKVEFLKECEII